VPRRAAWARFDRAHDPLMNLKGHQALGLAIDGDGKGELLAVRLESPSHLSFGAVADRYVPIDFTGRRVIALVETESDRWNDYVWNDGKSLYNVFRETIDFSKVEQVSLWCNNLPPDEEVRCGIGPVKALQMLPCTLRNPALTVNGRTLALPVEISSGSYLEFNETGDSVVYGTKGEVRQKLTLANPGLELRPGSNRIEFSCEPDNGPASRARLVIFSHGNPL
jgi:hypothetical protein